MTAVAVAVSPAARLVGGLLAGTGSLHAALSVDEVVAALDGLRAGPSVWSPSPFADDTQLDARLQQLGRPLERWARPDPALLEATAGVLDDGWRRAAPRPTGAEWAPPALRFEVDSFADLRDLQQMPAVDGWLVVGHIGMRVGRVAWSWPLRVTAASPAGRAALREAIRFPQHYRVEEIPEGGPVELAVVAAGDVAFLDHVLASVAVVTGAAAFDPTELLERARALGLGAVVLVPDSAHELLDELVVQLAHDEPLDVAAAVAAPGALVVAGAELLGITSIRTWAAVVAERADPASGVGPVLRDIAVTRRFDHESQGAEATVAAASAAIPEPDLRALTTIELQEAALAPPEEDVAVPPDERRLQARVIDAANHVRTDGFVAGERGALRVRIARLPVEGAVVADAAFRSPVAGRDIDVTVVVRVRDGDARPRRRTLRLPATADSTWTAPVPIDVPPHAAELAVEIVVLYKGRTVQSAVLRGPVLAAGTAPGVSRALVLAVDADTPPAALTSRTAGASTILVSTSVHGRPVVLDLSATARLLPPDRLEKAGKAIRRILLDTFLAPPNDLRSAAGPLTKLAVWGSTLRTQLKAGTGGFHDDDPWIHVVSFGDALVPFELIYTHEMPDDDDEVPVCAPALAGATECAPTCADRTRSDVVCPFGFWATSKVVERRVHVDDRARVTTPLQRKVAVISGAVAGMSTKADEEDATSSQRIADAIAAAVPTDHFRRVTTWKQLAEAVAAERPGVIVLVTHTVKPPGDDDELAVKFELGGDVRPAHRIDDEFVNPGRREPGPVVLALGCDTGDLDIGFADWVTTLHAAGAEVVVSTLSPVPGKEVALFVERMFSLLPAQFAGEPPHRFGAVLTAVRRATVATGDVLALSVTASGDGDVELVGAP